MIKRNRKWLLIATLMAGFLPVDGQFAFPGYPPQLYMPPPQPLPVAVLPVRIDITSSRSTTSTTTTTESSGDRDQKIAIAVPIPVPFPVQFGVPAMPGPAFCQAKPRPPDCPPCPPCVCFPTCTPAFFSFCSPCHLKCRCQDRNNLPRPMAPQPPIPVPGPAFPIPMPIPPMMPQPPPAIMVPFPPVRIIRPQIKSSSENSEFSSSSDSDSNSYSSAYYRRSEHKNIRRKRKFKRYKMKRTRGRRNFVRPKSGSDLLAKPMLSFVSGDGEVKINRKISNYEAAELLGKSANRYKKMRRVTVVAKDDYEGRPGVLISSNNMYSPAIKREKHVILREGITSRELDDGKKELVFRAPENKRISNLSVVFNVQ